MKWNGHKGECNPCVVYGACSASRLPQALCAYRSID